MVLLIHQIDILCTGNLVTKEHYEELRRLAPNGNVHIVKGIFDEEPFPESKTIQIGQFKIGLINGYQVMPWADPHSLSMVQRQMDTDILISGHTHKNEINEHDGKWFLNPGSITGASSIFDIEVVPSFILLAIQGSKVVSYIYELHGDQVDVLKSEFTKR